MQDFYRENQLKIKYFYFKLFTDLYTGGILLPGPLNGECGVSLWIKMTLPS